MRSRPAGEDLELLRRHVPRLVFDSLEALRPTRVEPYLSGSVVWDCEERVVAGSGAEIERERGQRDWMLNPLPDRRGGHPTQPPLAAHQLERAAHLPDAGAAHRFTRVA